MWLACGRKALSVWLGHRMDAVEVQAITWGETAVSSDCGLAATKRWYSAADPISLQKPRCETPGQKYMDPRRRITRTFHPISSSRHWLSVTDKTDDQTRPEPEMAVSTKR